MAQTPTNATILICRKTKLGETDLIITGFSEEGEQVRAVVKGARKPGSRLGSGLELYAVARVLLQPGKNLDTVIEAHLLQPNRVLSRDMVHNAGAAVIVEFLEKATREGMAEPRLWALSLEALRCIGEAGEEGVALLAAAALWKMAAQLGFCPDLAECVVCGRAARAATQSPSVPAGSSVPSPFTLSLELGGLTCADCRGADTQNPGAAPSSNPGATISPALTDWVRVVLKSRFVELLPQADARTTQLGFELLLLAHQWVVCHLGFRLKSLDFLAQLR